MFNIFNKKSKNNPASNKNVSSDQVLKEYANARFSLLDVDLKSLKLDAKPKHKDSYILTGRVKQSKIPIYTGNPFNPYF